MYDLVGERLREIFDAQVLDIGIYDRETGLIHFPYTIERGVRFPDEPFPLMGIRKHVIETREPLLINERATERAIEFGQPGAIQGEAAKSTAWAPLLVGGEATGVISLQNLDREFAFSDADLRVLTTLAASLSVSLENARLFDETQRLFTEADERAAELDDHQRRPARPRRRDRHAVDVRPRGRQDPRSLRCTGRRHRDPATARRSSSASRTRSSGASGCRTSRSRSSASESTSWRRASRFAHDRWDEELAASLRPARRVAGRARRSRASSCRMLIGGEARGVISLQNNDMRVGLHRLRCSRAQHARRQPQRRARERPPHPRDPPARDRARRRSTRSGTRWPSQFDLDRMYELVGDLMRRHVLGRPGLRRDARPRDGPDRVRRTTARTAQYVEQEGFTFGAGPDVAHPADPRAAAAQPGRGLRGARDIEASARRSSRSSGVPILVSDGAIGVISVQSMEAEGRFGAGGRAAARDDRRQRRHRDPERPAPTGGAAARRRDGGPGRHRPGHLGDARPERGPGADDRADACPCSMATRAPCTSRSRTAGRSGRSSRAGEIADEITADIDPARRGHHRRRRPRAASRRS